MNLLAAAAALHALADALIDGETLAPNTDTQTVAQVAQRLHRSPSTVRGWAEAGRFPGAFKLNGKDWRIPSEALESFLAGQRAQAVPRSTISTRANTGGPRRRARKGGAANLGAWRDERRRAEDGA